MGGWIAVVGSWKDGRSTVLTSLVRTLQASGLHIGGFVQATAHDPEGISGFDLTAVCNGATVPLARRSREPDLCDWRFRPEAFEQARAWMLDGDSSICFAHAGRVEASGRGHWPAIEESVGQRHLTIVAVTRSALAPVGLRLPDPVDGIELPAEEHEVNAFMLRVRRRGLQHASTVR